MKLTTYLVGHKKLVGAAVCSKALRRRLRFFQVRLVGKGFVGLHHDKDVAADGVELVPVVRTAEAASVAQRQKPQQTQQLAGLGVGPHSLEELAYAIEYSGWKR